MTRGKITDTLNDGFRRLPIFLHKNGFTASWLILYLAAGLLLIAHHEMWRDELEAWLIARDTSLPGLFSHLHTIGHPVLWYLSLKMLQLFTVDPSAMQYLHLLFALGSVTLFVRYAPFSRLEKILLAFSYFFLYEFAVIARNYAPAIFLIVLIVVLYSQPRKNLWLLALASVLLINTHVIGILFMFFFLTLFAYDWLGSSGNKIIPNLLFGTVLLILLLFAFGLAWQSLVPAGIHEIGNMVKNPFHNLIRLEYVAQTLWSSYVPIPRLTLHFWNSNLIPTYLARICLSILVFAVALHIVSPSRRARMFYTMGSSSLLVFFLLFHPGFLRHHGFLFLVFLVSYWIKRNEKPGEPERADTKKRLFRLILMGQCLAGLTAGTLEMLYPFSASKQVSKYIETQGLQKDTIIAGDWDYVSQSVSAWLNQPLYYPAIQAYGSFIVWSDPRRKFPVKTKPERRAYKEYVIRHLQDLADAEQKNVLLLSTYAQKRPLLKSFTKAVQADEVFYLYLITPDSCKIQGSITDR
ncbi:MAG TPA: hypothetical protein PKN04_11295 [bacterium]|nr:hypothetical protein [bacterium]HNT66356.1 hypothetical protein [bacterium]